MFLVSGGQSPGMLVNSPQRSGQLLGVRNYPAQHVGRDMVEKPRCEP